MAAVFTPQTTSFPASLYFGVDSSATNTALYAGGVVQYVVFEPDSAAVAAMGWTGQPSRLIVQCQGSGSGNLTAPVGTNEGQQMGEQIGFKLGYNYATAANGSAATPDANWPTYVVFPQFFATSPTGSEPSAGARANRGNFMVLEAVVKDMCSKYNIDRTRMYLSGFSGGAGTVLEYTYARSRWPQHFTLDFAAQIVMAGTVNGSGSAYRQDLPEMQQGENSTTQTVPRILAKMARTKLPTYWFNSQSDGATTVAIYGPTFTMLNQWEPSDYGIPVPAGFSTGNFYKNGQWSQRVEYTTAGGVAPDHPGVWNLALGNNAAGGAMDRAAPLFTWLFSKQFRAGRPSHYSRLARITGRGLL
ncbi:MAG: hypothetical protein JWL61_5417 [Gemmatimonadetes bacterium]|nr:hypothetical protein [Gemmatimonadota bacterium]